MRIGTGFDSHPLVKGRKLIIGGAEIPFKKGLGGWSDADVLTHAVIDALLGAAAMGDIGGHFPPGEPEYKDISSLTLLKKAGDKLAQEGWRIENIDATVIAEEPKLAGYIHQMRQNISRALDISFNTVSVKASSANKVGSIGKGDGIQAHAVCLIDSASNQGGNMVKMILDQIGLMTASPEENDCSCPLPQENGATGSNI